MNVVVAGASGFIGSSLLSAAPAAGLLCQPVSVRHGTEIQLPKGDVLVHLAGIAHSGAGDEDHVNDVNRDLPIKVAEKARSSGYRQFVFLSSALVWGDGRDVVSFRTPENPSTAYGRAKLQAEEALRKLSRPDFALTIIRPPLVYGPGVKGNLAKLLDAVNRWPICPLGVNDNRRSMVNVENVVALISHLINTQTDGTFCALDHPPVSSLEVLKKMAYRMPKHGLVIPMPRLARAALAVSAPGILKRLTGSLVIEDDSAAKAGFVPRATMDQGFDDMVARFLLKQVRSNAE